VPAPAFSYVFLRLQPKAQGRHKARPVQGLLVPRAGTRRPGLRRGGALCPPQLSRIYSFDCSRKPRAGTRHGPYRVFSFRGPAPVGPYRVFSFRGPAQGTAFVGAVPCARPSFLVCIPSTTAESPGPAQGTARTGSSRSEGRHKARPVQGLLAPRAGTRHGPYRVFSPPGPAPVGPAFVGAVPCARPSFLVYIPSTTAESLGPAQGAALDAEPQWW